MANRVSFGRYQLPGAAPALVPAASRNRHHGPRHWMRLLLGCLAVLLVPLRAAAADHPQEAFKLIIKQNTATGKATVTWVTKNPSLVLPAVPPTSVGATLAITGIDGRVFAALPSGNWQVNRKGTQYKFRNKLAPGGTSPVKVSVLKAGKVLNVVVRDSLIQLDNLQQGTVGIALTVGSDTYCSVCTTPERDEPGKYSAKLCTAPVDCRMTVPTFDVCGNAVCDVTEDCASCPQDCGLCPAECGDLVCASTEDCSGCPADCGPCPDRCGDLTCGPTETCSTCPEDCGTCVDSCGNGICEESEGCSSCPQDCGACATRCGNGACEEDEDCIVCVPDCGECPSVCGDDICVADETCVTCPLDCGECPLVPGGQGLRLPAAPAAAGVEDNNCKDYAKAFEDAAKDFSIPANLLRAVARAESTCIQVEYRPKKDDCGIMQITGTTRAAVLEGLTKKYGVEVTKDDICNTDPKGDGAMWNIRGGAWLLTSDTPDGKKRFADVPTYKGVFDSVENQKLAETLEAWWFPVAAYNGAGGDGKVATSDYVFRVWGKMWATPELGKTMYKPSYAPLVQGTMAYCSNGARTPDDKFEVAIGDCLSPSVWPTLEDFIEHGIQSCGSINPPMIPNCGQTVPSVSARIRWVRGSFDFLWEVPLHKDDGSFYCSGISCRTYTYDLAPQAGTVAPNPVSAGADLKVEYRLANLGTGVVTEHFTDRFYLSDDTKLDRGGDQLVGFALHEAQLGPGPSPNLSQKVVSIPLGTAAGNRYLLVVVDDSDTVVETNEDNNVFPVPVSIMPPAGKDLVIEGLGTSIRSVSPGGQVTVSYRVVNRGGQTVTEDYLEEIWLSTKPTLDKAKDKLLTPTAIHAEDLAAGASVPVKQPVTIPGTEAGYRYLIVVADAGESVTESSETNNQRPVLIAVGIPTRLPAPTLSSPPDGALGVALTPTFSWSVVSGASLGYRLMIATTRSALQTRVDRADCPGCTLNVEVARDETSFIPSMGELTAATQYWWQVKGRNRDQFGTWSAPATFTTATSTGRYTDNGDGTITDTQTGLQWEKKTTAVGSGQNYNDPHDVDNYYTWTDTSDGDYTDADGTAFTDFLVKLNTSPCFAGHCDWRLPRSGGRPDWGDPSGEPAELESILLAPYPCGTIPCIDPVFGPTAAYLYWSSTTYAIYPYGAWYVGFSFGYVDYDFKFYGHYVRAVRGGS